MEIYRFERGDTPLLVSVPHAGTYVPDGIAARLSPDAAPLPDTDWHVDRLYDFVADLGAGVLVANHSRFVVDLNRDPEGAELYPGASNTAVCPTTTFDEQPVYLPGLAPDDAEIKTRVETYWTPYHRRLRGEVAVLKARFGLAIVLDAHSIRSVVPRFFDGRLPDLNFGTAGGKSAAPDFSDHVFAVLDAADGYSAVRDGRFKGGYITRTYGQPDEGVHAVQLELTQSTYMDEDPPYTSRRELARKIQPTLRALLEEALDWVGEQH